MATLNVQVEIVDKELLEVSEDVGRLLGDRDGDFSPASCRLFFAIDEALTEALAPLLGAHVGRADADTTRPMREELSDLVAHGSWRRRWRSRREADPA
jgi:hypothetical protein